MKAKDLLVKYKLTIIMVTHNVTIPINYGNRVVILNDKKIAFDKKYTDGDKRDKELFLKYVNPIL